MILSTLDADDLQLPALSGLRDGLEFLRGLRGSLPDGRVPIRGDDVFALISSYETRVVEGWRFEGHRRHLDIQCLTSGEELLGYAPRGAAAVTTPYNEAQDIWFGTVPPAEQEHLRLVPGRFALLFPDDAHAPGHAVDVPRLVRKVVIKIRLAP